MRFVDDVDLERTKRGREVHFLAQITNLIDAPIRRRVDLNQIQSGARSHLDARLTLVARLSRSSRTSRAVHRLRQHPRRRRLPGAATSPEQAPTPYPRPHNP